MLHVIKLSDTHCRATLDEGSTRRKDLYLNNTRHSQETNIHVPGGFEPAIPGSERPQTYALDYTVTGID